nr:DUF6389 family protein [Mesonia aestuariivivens]
MKRNQRFLKSFFGSILNYFINRSTNASAESFNAKIKAFRSQFRGVKNIEFFLIQINYNFCLNTIIRIDPSLLEETKSIELIIFPDQVGEETFKVSVFLSGPNLYVLNQAI